MQPIKTPLTALALGIVTVVLSAACSTNADTFSAAHSALEGEVCASASENGTANVSCPAGQTISKVTFASYGSPTGVCGSYSASDSCSADNSQSIVEAACLGKDSCSVDASNGVFGDPCWGTEKSLAIQVQCSGGATPPPTAPSAPPSGGSTGPAGNGAPLTAGTISCGTAATGGAGSGGGDAIAVDTLGTVGGDSSRQYRVGQPIALSFATQPGGADTVVWSIEDAWQRVQASGQFAVGGGASTSTVQCTSTLSGYFAITAKLQTSGASLPQRGTRPAGIATFGVLPDLDKLMPAVSYPSADSHRFGMQGAAYIRQGDPFNPFAKNLGATWVNKGRAWSDMEPGGPGQFNPSTFQDDPSYGDSYLASNGLVPYVDLSGIPSWANSSGGSNANYPPKSFSDYQNFTGRVGQERAAAKSKNPNLAQNYYQVTWEPDPGTGNAWQGSNADFVNLYKAAYTGIHGSDPNAVVLGVTGSSVQASIEMMNTMLGAGLGQYLDGVSYHGYYDAGCFWDHPPEATSWGKSLPTQMRELRHIVATSLKPHAKLIQSELGIRYALDGQYGANYPSRPQLAEQGAVVARAHLIELGEGADVSYFFYSADFPGDIGSGLNFDLVYNENDASTLWGTGAISPKPGFMMAATLTRLVDGTTTLGHFDGLPANAYGYAFQRLGNGPAITSLWTHNTGWNATVNYGLRVGAPGTSGQVVVVDAMGNASYASVSDGVVSLTLGEYPTYVISTDVATIKSQVTAPEGY